MKMLNKMFLVSVVFVLLLSSINFAANWYVNKTGCRLPDGTYHGTTVNTNTTIQGAILTIARTGAVGDTLIICNETAGVGPAGYYAENLSINISITLTSFGGLRTPNITHGSAAPVSGGIINVSANYVNISNISINQTGGVITSIYIDGYNFTNISNINMTDPGAAVATAGIAINFTNGTNIESSRIFSVTAANGGWGITLRNTTNTTISSNTLFGGLDVGIIIRPTVGNLSMVSNTIENTSYAIRAFDVINATINSNTVRNATAIGMDFTNNTRISAASNVIFNNGTAPAHGMSINNTLNSTFTSNRVENISGVAFYIVNSSNVTLLSNVVRNNNDTRTIDSASKGSFYLLNSTFILLQSNTVNESIIGFHIFNGSNNNTLIGNTAYNNSQYGFLINLSSYNTTFITTTNTAYNNSIGFLIANTPATSQNIGMFTNMSLVNATNNSLYGFYFVNSSAFINAANASGNLYVNYFITNSSNVTFLTNVLSLYTGISTPTTWDLNISVNSTATTLYGGVLRNFTMQFLVTMFDNASNVSFKAMNHTTAGYTLSGANSIDSCSPNEGNASCYLLSGNNMTNITNNSGLGKIDLGIYYNTTKASSIPIDFSRLFVAKNDTNGWVRVGQGSRDTNAGYVFYSGITSFSLFSIIGVAPNATALQSGSSGGGSSLSSMSVSESIICPNVVEVLVTSGGSAVSGITVRLIQSSPFLGEVASGSTDSSGKIQFALPRDGGYTIDTSASGYVKPSDVVFNYERASCGAQPPTPQPVPAPTPAPEVNETPPAAPPAVPPTAPVPDLSKTASKDISDADAAILVAKNGGKDVTAANSKLAEAKAAYAKGDYAKASSLAKEAMKLAQTAKPAAPKTSTTTAPKEQPKGGFDFGGIGVITLVVVVILVALYFLFMKRKGGAKEDYKGFKK